VALLSRLTAQFHFHLVAVLSKLQALCSCTSLEQSCLVTKAAPWPQPSALLEAALPPRVKQVCCPAALQVLRYWPKDAGRNKGDPWFAAVVTDYEEDTGAHILTYQFGTQKEEKERVSLGMKRQDELRVSLTSAQLSPAH